ncbi:MAG: energy-coupling factor ABC transporter permease [Clostridium sp.]
MHMSNHLLSPEVGVSMLALVGGISAYAVLKSRGVVDKPKVALMASAGALVFAAQMINFTIPGTGSSGHIGGGILLAMLLGPYLGFLTMSSILTVQCLFFADGGLLALGANIFNLGVFPCLVVYPLINKFLQRRHYSSNNIIWVSIVSVVISITIGAASVTFETLMSGITALNFKEFFMLMIPIHIAIGIVEGIITAGVLIPIYRLCPSAAYSLGKNEAINKVPIRNIIGAICISSLITSGGLSYFASSQPDGLEWSVMKVSGETEIVATGGIYNKLDQIQGVTSFMPDYGLKGSEGSMAGGLAGVTGVLLTLGFTVIIGRGIKSYI